MIHADLKDFESNVNAPPQPIDSFDIFEDIRNLIEGARQNVAIAINTGLTMLYWKIGSRINLEILKGERAAYGAEILQALSAKLTIEFGRGFSRRNLASMIRIAEVYPDEKIVNFFLRVDAASRRIILFLFNERATMPLPCSTAKWKRKFLNRDA